VKGTARFGLNSDVAHAACMSIPAASIRQLGCLPAVHFLFCWLVGDVIPATSFILPDTIRPVLSIEFEYHSIFFAKNPTFICIYEKFFVPLRGLS
jgi:hypothetical protein